MTPDHEPGDAIEPDGVFDEGSDLDDDAVDPLAALLGGGPGGGGLDFGALMESASAMQAQLLAAQEEAAKAVVEGVAGGGVVRVEVTGGFEFRSVTIDPSAVDPDDVEMLQDLVLAALRHAVDQIGESQASAVDLGGLGLGGVDLGGLFGN